MTHPNLIVVATLLLAGCAHEHGGKPAFEFNRADEHVGWQSLRFELAEIAKDYAREKNLTFDFEGTTQYLRITQHGGLRAEVWFLHRPGDWMLTVEIDASGKVVRHRLEIDKS